MSHIDPITLDTEPIDTPKQWQPGRITAELERLAPGLLNYIKEVSMDEKDKQLLLNLRAVSVRLADISCTVSDRYPDKAQWASQAAVITGTWADDLSAGPRLAKELLNEIDKALNDYDQRRRMAVEILQRPGMEEAIIDELESMGFVITEAS